MAPAKGNLWKFILLWGGEFKKHAIFYSGITNNYISNSTFTWYTHLFGPNETVSCFNIIQGPDYPCAVISRGRGRNDYQINLWYNAKNQIHIDGQVLLQSASYHYLFSPYVKENHQNDEDNGIPKLLLYKFTMPADDCYSLNWWDDIRNTEVTVTDFYGNEGTITLTFNHTDNFDKPGIV